MLLNFVFGCSFVFSLLFGLYGKGSAAVGLYRAFLALTIVFGFLLTWELIKYG